MVKEVNRLRKVKVDGEERLATLNLAEGIQVYNERLIKLNGLEYRVWDPFRSKLAAALLKGLKENPIDEGIKLLYLGVSTGTTASHISDIIGEKGILFGVEFAPRVAREFIDRVVKYRRNVIPIIEDARRPDRYFSIFGKVDVVYCDLAQPDQTDIAILNCKRYLKNGGHLLLVVKSRSIDVTKQPKEIFKGEAEKLENEGFRVNQIINLDPFDKDHALIDAIME
ncbi:MAG: fibrillarin-like rRNA/tRNA 2'-O-methyltransferase [Nitrososphaerota archaeon]|nr:fibrillarin-like rRNA/tRNA 2'-O-methyltransferase [Nitrososphaerales archaeon]MCX8191865.1 fibrillarin-like rRNA/tRNA 2'-O-methyltransferase [Nitrososphaerales archaeon]MDW8044960.1 fibrillarin-like rRNA/tRNA 2'-O-methyltransferase [Nitrososphaerota archaeon]